MEPPSGATGHIGDCLSTTARGDRTFGPAGRGARQAVGRSHGATKISLGTRAVIGADGDCFSIVGANEAVGWGTGDGLLFPRAMAGANMTRTGAGAGTLTGTLTAGGREMTMTFCAYSTTTSEASWHICTYFVRRFRAFRPGGTGQHSPLSRRLTRRRPQTGRPSQDGHPPSSFTDGRSVARCETTDGLHPAARLPKNFPWSCLVSETSCQVPRAPCSVEGRALETE